MKSYIESLEKRCEEQEAIIASLAAKLNKWEKPIDADECEKIFNMHKDNMREEIKILAIKLLSNHKPTTLTDNLIKYSFSRGDDDASDFFIVSINFHNSAPKNIFQMLGLAKRKKAVMVNMESDYKFARPVIAIYEDKETVELLYKYKDQIYQKSKITLVNYYTHHIKNISKSL